MRLLVLLLRTAALSLNDMLEDGNFIEVPVLTEHGQEKLEKYHFMVCAGPSDGCVKWCLARVDELDVAVLAALGAHRLQVGRRQPAPPEDEAEQRHPARAGAPSAACAASTRAWRPRCSP